MASKTRNTSMPFFTARSTKALHHVVGVVAVAEAGSRPRSSICCLGFGAWLLSSRRRHAGPRRETDDAGVQGGAAPAFESRSPRRRAERQSAKTLYRQDAGGWRTRDWWASRRTTSVMAMVMGSSGKLEAMVAVMVNGGGNHRQAGKVVRRRGGGRCQFWRRAGSGKKNG